VVDSDTDAESGSGAPERRSEPLVSAESLAGLTRALGWLLVIGGAGLAATGVPLIFLYRPDDPVTGDRADLWWLRGAHSVASMLFIGAAAGIVAVLAVAAVRRLRVPPGWFVGLAALLVALLGLMSGQLIAWDRLVMEPPTDGSDARGMVDALSDDVHSVVVDGAGVSRGSYAGWAGVHVVAVPLLALGLAGIVRRRARHGRPPDEAPPEADNPGERPAPGLEPRTELR
jgi:quinol-cytochrome oxidoreductase complex cytochrome b subunit